MAKKKGPRLPSGRLKKSDGEITRRIGRWVKSLREARGWSQGEVERRADLSVGSVTRLENGTSSIVGIDTVVRLSEALSVPLEILVYGKLLKHPAQLPLLSDDGESPSVWAMAPGGTRGARRLLVERPPRGVDRPPKTALRLPEKRASKASKAKSDR